MIAVINKPENSATLRSLITLAKAMHLDRLSYVRPQEPPAIFVLLLSTKALRECGPCLQAAAKKLGKFDHIEPPECVGPADSIRKLFEYQDRMQLPWSWGTPEVDGFEICATCFIGREICEEIAPQLTALGCITSLK